MRNGGEQTTIRRRRSKEPLSDESVVRVVVVGVVIAVSVVIVVSVVSEIFPTSK